MSRVLLARSRHVQADRVFVPEGVESASARDLLRHRQAPQAVELDHDVHLRRRPRRGSCGTAPARRPGRPADVLAVAALGREVERPDLHAGDALLQQRLGQFVGAVQETLEVLVGPALLADAPVGAWSGRGHRGCTGSRRRCCRCGCASRLCRPAPCTPAWPALPKMSHSAMSIAELPRVSTPEPRQPR